jgi:hypothetical protein
LRSPYFTILTTTRLPVGIDHKALCYTLGAELPLQTPIMHFRYPTTAAVVADGSPRGKNTLPL